MYLPNAILGKHIVDKLVARTAAPVLLIGSDTFTRRDLSRAECFNFHAAARLTHLFLTELKVKNARDLFNNYPPELLAVPGLGAICLATVGAAFEVKKLGNLGDYIARHTKAGHAIVTFSTMKINVLDQQAAKNEKKDLKRRKAARQDKAHELRVERHVTRATAVNPSTH